MTPSDVHSLLIGQVPELEHRRLYSSGKNGFSDRAFDESRFLAVAMLTLAKALRTSNPSRVVLFISPTHDKWVVRQFDDISAVAFRSIAKGPGSPEGIRSLAHLFGDAWKMIFYTSRLLQFQEKPEAWTSFGFSIEDPIPEWMREGLL